MSNLLTDRAFWVNYWESKKALSVIIPANYLFHRKLAEVINTYQLKSAIELGGFPGYYAVFLKKYHQLEMTLLDYFVHPPLTTELLKKNGLKETDITVIEADLFNYTSEKQYDLVLSCGLIEHFEDTEDIINRHIALLNPGGVLFITLPNFKAVNGWFQRKFDKANYDKHNINSMDPKRLGAIAKAAGLDVLQSDYFGKFSIWLENESDKPGWVRMVKKLTWTTGKVFSKIFPFESKPLSPYIILVARKPL